MQSIIIFIRKHKNFNLSIWVNGVTFTGIQLTQLEKFKHIFNSSFIP